RNNEASPTVATIAVAMSGPTPGILASRWLIGLSRPVPATNFSVDRGDPFLELDELRDEQPEHLSSRFWNCVLIKMCPQPSYVPDALRFTNAELCQKATQGVNQLGPLSH